MKLYFSLKSFLVFLSLFVIEVLIALYAHDNLIRPYFGDTLVVIMIYYFIKTFFRIKPAVNIIGVTLFAFLIECMQYLNFVQVLGLEGSRFWTIVIGNSFNWVDLIAYLAGAIILWMVEIKWKRNPLR